MLNTEAYSDWFSLNCVGQHTYSWLLEVARRMPTYTSEPQTSYTLQVDVDGSGIYIYGHRSHLDEIIAKCLRMWPEQVDRETGVNLAVGEEINGSQDMVGPITISAFWSGKVTRAELARLQIDPRFNIQFLATKQDADWHYAGT